MMQRSFQQGSNSSSPTPFAGASATPFSTSLFPGESGFKQESGCLDVVVDGAGGPVSALPHLQLPSPSSSTGYSMDTPRPYDSGPAGAAGTWDEGAVSNSGSFVRQQLQQQQRRLFGDHMSPEIDDAGSIPPSPIPQPRGRQMYGSASLRAGAPADGGTDVGSNGGGLGQRSAPSGVAGGVGPRLLVGESWESALEGGMAMDRHSTGRIRVSERQLADRTTGQDEVRFLQVL